MTRHFLSVLLLCCAAGPALAACDSTSRFEPTPGTSAPPGGSTEPEQPFVCPAGMPSWKCDQLQKDNGGVPTTPPSPPT